VDRWFSLPDDLTYFENGAPDTKSGMVQPGRRYSYAYLLRRPQAFSDQMVELYVVVYSGRPTDVLTVEPTYKSTGAAGGNRVTLSWTVPQTAPGVKRGMWVLDTTFAGGVVQGDFYRVVNLAETNANSMVLEVQPNLKANVNALTIMEDVAEVFDKGTSWQP
jgi:hypothetical protein